MHNRFPPLADQPRAQARAIARPTLSLPWFQIGITFVMITLLHAL